MPDTPHPKPAHLHPSDLRALARLLANATVGVTDIVEAVHIGVAPPVPSPFGRGLGRGSAPAQEPSPNPSQGAGDQRRGGLAPLTYRTIRSATRFIGAGMDAALAPLEGLLGPRHPSPQRRAALAALNGVMGDYLAESGSPLALPMTIRHDGADLPRDPAALAAALPGAGGKLLLLVHGLCLGDACWECAGGGLGGALARDGGYTTLSLSYNSGRHVSVNGRELAARLAALVTAWPRPVEELVIVGHSMGGLVARSAIHYGTVGGYSWPARLRALITLGTPHHGAPLERGGNWINVMMDGSPYAAPFSRLGKGRSAGITDLRYGSLVDEDWHGRDRFAHGGDERATVPLPAGARCYAVAATLAAVPPPTPSPSAATLGVLHDQLLGDGLVPLDSALGRHPDPARALPFDATWIGYEMSHTDLLRRREVIEQVGRWLR